LWKIQHAPGERVTLSSLQDAEARLSLPAKAASGVHAGITAPADPVLARWNFVAVCELPQKAFKDHTLPCVIEAEDYDTGCAGDAYRDTDDINQGGLYRTDTGVDLGECSAGGYTLGWTQPGEWTTYTVNVPASASYRVSFHVATARDGARFHLESDGADLTGPVDLPNTKSFQIWTVVDRVIHLDAGQHVLKVVIDGNFVNLDKMVFETTP